MSCPYGFREQKDWIVVEFIPCLGFQPEDLEKCFDASICFHPEDFELI
jgi:hypothetical protein